MPVDDAIQFLQAAWQQRVCAVCGLPTAYFEAHHVVEKQELRRRRLPRLDPRNALRLCDERANNCHSRHTSATRRVRLDELRDENVAYAFEVLGAYAYDYLRRRYDGFHDDRLDAHLEAVSA